MPAQTAIHRRVNDARAGRDPTVLGRCASGWAVFGHRQFVEGYLLLLPGWLAIGDNVERGRRLLFVRRDREAAERDLRQMLEKLRGRAGTEIKGGVYFACVARGANLFGTDSQEMAILADALGPVPLVSFLANGEICHNRLYGYTGVLALFL